MATTGNNTGSTKRGPSKSKSKSTGATGRRTSTTSTTRPRAAASTGARDSGGTVAYVRETGERAFDLPVGAVLTVRERINGVVQPWTTASTRSREIKGLRRQVKAELDRFENRGGKARRSATDRVRQTRGRLTERVRAAETTVQESRARVGDGLKKAQTSVQERVSALA